MLWAGGGIATRALQPSCDSILPPNVGAVGDVAERVPARILNNVVMWSEGQCRGGSRLLENDGHLDGDRWSWTDAGEVMGEGRRRSNVV